MREQKRDCLKITVPRELALDCQRVLETQGVPLNVTQAVKAMLTFAVQSKPNALIMKPSEVVMGNIKSINVEVGDHDVRPASQSKAEWEVVQLLQSGYFVAPAR